MRWSTSAMLGVALALAPTSFAHADDDASSVKVHVIGDRDLVLERNLPDSELWETLCDGACDMNVPRDGKYRLAGRGIRVSPPLTLDTMDTQKNVRIEAHAVYAAGWVGGVLLTTFGPLAMIGGAFALGIGLNQNEIAPCPFDTTCQPTQQNHVATIGGALTFGVGVLMTVAGIFALVTTDHTTARQIAKFTARGASISF